MLLVHLRAQKLDYLMLNIVVLDFYSVQKLMEQMMETPQHSSSEFIGTYMPKYVLNFILVSGLNVGDC